ncbi:MAG: MotA/TolQ/ExbB proton channel family protein [Verrucomicrobia bacterium]|nr:MotA/TolQ/ExbB proton channel family protein [Verrucomicrobiota bacterium]MCH8511697.1 MotA/TolQ/ExbB proton channel family protein [Kiritimatiellia bacterium]
MNRALCYICLSFFALSARANLQRAVLETRNEVRAENISLLREREEIAEKRRQLHAELREREARVANLREEVERLRRVQRQSTDEARRQRQALETARQREQEIRAISREARRGLEAQLPVAAAVWLQPQLERIDLGLRTEGPESAVDAARETLEAFDLINENLNQAFRLPAAAVRRDGLELQGTALLLGPLHWFASEDETHAGLLADRTDDALPRLWPVQGPAIPALIRGESAEVPTDLTKGRALRLDEAARPWLSRLQDGGVTMIPLGLTALASLILVLWKTLALINVRGRDPKLVNSVATALRKGDFETATLEVSKAPEPLRTLLQGALAHTTANAEELEELMHERMLGVIPRLDRHLGTLAVLGGVAPLLGLLGTVTGMIHTFELVTLFGSGNERILSQGISEALVTTMSGLIIAVPVLLAHAFLSRRVRVIISELEQSIAGFIQARHRREDITAIKTLPEAEDAQP